MQTPISRRTFLRLVAWSSTLTAVTACSDAVTPSPDRSETAATDSVLIIGAGMAGLAAAQTLHAQGVTVTLLEARDRIGGRIFTDRSLGVPVDLGASWIHGPDGNPLTQLAQAAGATLFVTDDEQLIVYDQAGNEIAPDRLDAAFELYVELLSEATDQAEAGQSLAQAIASINPQALTDPLLVYQLSSYTEFDAGGDITDLSAQFWADDEAFKGADVLFPAGYDTLINHLAQGLDIRLQQVVQTVHLTASGVEITTNQGSFEADYCICTLPIGVLQAGDVQFTPALPDILQQALMRIGVGHVNKVALQFATSFWDSEQYIGYTAPIKGQYSYLLNADTFIPNAHMLITFGFGNYGLTLESQPDNSIQRDIMTILETIYEKAATAPQAILISRWSADPFSKGSYSFAGIQTQPSDFEQFEKAVAERLIWAGEHTSQAYRGTVHGAYLSGLRAANWLLED